MDLETETGVSYLRGRDALEDAFCEIKYRVQGDGAFSREILNELVLNNGHNQVYLHSPDFLKKGRIARKGSHIRLPC